MPMLSIIGPETYNLISNNNSVSLMTMGFSPNNIAGIGSDALVYTFTHANNNQIEMKETGYFNITNLTNQRIQIFENASKSISHFMIIANRNV